MRQVNFYLFRKAKPGKNALHRVDLLIHKLATAGKIKGILRMVEFVIRKGVLAGYSEPTLVNKLLGVNIQRPANEMQEANREVNYTSFYALDPAGSSFAGQSHLPPGNTFA
jgi:hypothetical protein